MDSDHSFGARWSGMFAGSAWSGPFQEAIRAVWDLGWTKFRSGEWLSYLIQRSFRQHWEAASAEAFHDQFPGCDQDRIAKKLIARAAKDASAVGAVTGVIVSADEIATLLTAGEGIVGLPANIVIAVGSVAAELVLFLRIQLRLIAELARLYGVTLDPDKTDEVLSIVVLAAGGAAATDLRNYGIGIGGSAARASVKRMFSDHKISLLKLISAKAGKRMLRRSLLKNTLAVASIGIGAGSNYFAMKSIGRLAMKHFRQTGTQSGRASLSVHPV
jgi:EcsC protein family